MRKNKILLVIPEFGYGGAEKSFCALSVELSKIYDTKIVVFNLLQAPVYPIGGDVLSLEVFSSNNWITKLIGFYKRVIRLRKIKRQLKPDVSISFLEGADYINLISSIGEKTVCSIRGSKKYDQNIFGISRILKESLFWPMLYRQAHAIVTVNHGIKKEVSSLIGDEYDPNISVIASTLNKSKILSQAKETLSQPYIELFDEKTLVSIGRIAPEKGLHLFLSVFKSLVSLNSNLKYVIIGTGDWLQKLLRLCDELYLSYHLPDQEFSTNHQVYFVGYDANPIKYIANANIFVLPSTHEGYPNALIEALHTNTKVVAADCPYGPREIIAKETNYDISINYPFIANNAILLPRLEKNNSSANKIWQKTILKELDSNLPKSNTKPYIPNNKNTWTKLISNLLE